MVRTKYHKRDLKPEEWMDEISEGLKYRQKYGLEDQWNDMEALYYNVHESQSTASPNLISSTGDSLLSELSVPLPYLLVEPLRHDSVESAPILESIDNSIMWDINLMEQMELAYLHAYLWGVGFLKIGYDSEHGWNPRLDLAGTPGASGMTDSQFDKKGRRIEKGYAHPGMPWVRAVLPHDIIFPWGTSDIETCEWYAHRVIRHVDDCKADPKYGNTSKLQPVMSMEDFMKSTQSLMKSHRAGSIVRRSGDNDAEYCELWEIHDRMTGRVIVTATGHKELLRNDDDFLQTGEGPPLVDVRFTPKSRSIWVTSDAFYLRYHQAEQIDIALQGNKQRRMGVLKFGYLDGSVEDDELDKALGPEVGMAFRVNSGQVSDVRNAIVPFQPGNNISLWQDMEVGRRMAREVVGFSRNRYGEFESGRRTATEAGIVDRSGNVRMSRRHTAVKRTYIKAFRKINEIITSFWRAPRITRVMGPDGQRKFVRFVGQNLRGQYRLKVDFSTEAGTTLQQRRQEALMMYQMLSQDPSVNQQALRGFLSSAFNDPELAGLFSGQQSRVPGLTQQGGGQNSNLQLPMSSMQRAS